MDKPTVKLSGQDGNVYNIINLVSKALERAGLKYEANKFTEKALDSHGYDEVIQLAMEYVEVE